MKKTIKFSNASLCEYVAKGAGNKHTLVNVFGGDVIVSEMPAQMMFGIYIELMPEPILTPVVTVEIILDKSVIATLPVDVSGAVEGRPLNVVIQSLTFQIENDITLEVVASAPGRGRTTMLSKRLYKGVIPQLS
ncbi:hypothetical protein [Mesorhizobium sp. M1322]|uniref:hypothetical protein n=1 Tax=Mesorhizobium sp. M1322 TaxID=2957081 RepID=UPI00333B0A1D